MPGIFQDYKIALLDSSFFMAPFPKAVQDGLREIKVYVSDTFNTEIEQYSVLLSQARSTFFNSNIFYLKQNMHLNTVDLASFGEKSEDLHNDVWGLITLFQRINPNAKIILVTANKILIQKIVLHDIKIDIFDLNTTRFLTYAEFDRVKQFFEFDKAEWIDNTTDDTHVTKGSRLYKKDGSFVILGDVINSGLESHLHKIENMPNLVAKIFKKEKLSPEKYSNLIKLAGINRYLEISWALFPSDMLYFDPENTKPAGFTEGFAYTGHDLSDNPLFAGQLETLPFECINTRLSATVELCIKVVRQVCYLSNFGFFVSDYNTGNFATVVQDNRFIQMWDTDSFGFDTFFSGYCSGDKTTKDYDTSTKIGALDFCSEALYLFVFSLLSLGDSPMSEYSGKFKYDNPSYPFLYRIRLFPPNIWQLFCDVFRGQKLPSSEALLRQLSVALNNLYVYPQSNKTYGELLADIIPPAPQPAQTPDPYATQLQQPTSEQLQQQLAPVAPKNGNKMPIWPWFLLGAAVLIIILIIIFS